MTKLKTAIVSCMTGIIPNILWIILGIHQHMGMGFYIVLAALSIADGVNIAVTIYQNRRMLYERMEAVE